MNTFADELRARGLVFQHTGESLDAIVATPRTLYMGVDPTADSLHAGSLLPLMVLRRFLEHGYRVVVLVGGATAQIGDPSGKSAERVLLSEEVIKRNVERVREQIHRILGTDTITFVDNADWLANVPTLAFLRDIGKHFTVNEMLRKESVRARIEDPQSSISFTEFSYMLLQAYDFYVLHTKHGCDLQVGGSDQWGNITAGVELIRKKTGDEVHGITIPLLVDPKTGKKFGKTEAGTIWLDAEKLSPYHFYQFWLNTDDVFAVPYLKYFTLLSLDELSDLERTTAEHPEHREAQARLAYEVTSLIHGAEHASQAERVSKALFSGTFAALSAEERALVLRVAPSRAYPADVLAQGVAIVDVLVDTGLASSKRDARTLIDSGAVSQNGTKVTDALALVRVSDLVDGIVVLRKGKRETVLVHVS